MSEDDISPYDNSNRAFLQAFIARAVLTFDEAKPILAAILTVHGTSNLSIWSDSLTDSQATDRSAEKKDVLPEDVTEADFNSYISAANAKISAFDLEIRSTYHQTTRQRIYSLVNSTSDPVSQLATIHTADEISFLKRVLDAMFETFNTKRHEIMAINSMQAMKYAKPPSEDRRESQNGATQGSSGQGLTLIQAEKMLKTLVDEGWFEKSRKGFYSLSTRALMELRGWLIESYNDPDDEDGDDQTPKIKQCIACKEIITVVSNASVRKCCQDLISRRDNDATKRAVHAGCTIFARRISSESRNRRSAHFARPSGVAHPTWASAPSPLWIGMHRPRKEATLQPDKNRVLARNPTSLRRPMTSKIRRKRRTRKKSMRTRKKRKMERAMRKRKRKRITDTPQMLWSCAPANHLPSSFTMARYLPWYS